MQIQPLGMETIQQYDSSIKPGVRLNAHWVNCKIQYRPEGEIRLTCFERPMFKEDRDTKFPRRNRKLPCLDELRNYLLMRDRETVPEMLAQFLIKCGPFTKEQINEYIEYCSEPIRCGCAGFFEDEWEWIPKDGTETVEQAVRRYYDGVVEEEKRRREQGQPLSQGLEEFQAELTQLEQERIRYLSVKRARDKAFEIGLANDFQYFFTLTLDKDKINRYDKDVIYPYLRDWLSNRVKRNDMNYILFPEYHKLKAGEEVPAIHFHALASGEKFKLVDSGKKTKGGQVIYNLENWKFGYSTAIELDGRPAIIKYVTKYITKDSNKIFGRYYLSGGKTLVRELPADYLNLDYDALDAKPHYIVQANVNVKYKTLFAGQKQTGDGGDDEDEMQLEEP